MTQYVSQLFITLMKYISDLKEERFILIHWISLWLLGHIALGLWQHSASWSESMVKEACSYHDSQKAKTERKKSKSQYSLQE
jgi:hypothetical protein